MGYSGRKVFIPRPTHVRLQFAQMREEFDLIVKIKQSYADKFFQMRD